MEKFSVSVNIAANSSVTFTLTYEELLQRRLGKYELMIRVKPKQLVQHFEVGHQSVFHFIPLLKKLVLDLLNLHPHTHRLLLLSMSPKELHFWTPM